MNRRSFLTSAAALPALRPAFLPAQGPATGQPGKARLKPALCAYSFRQDLQSGKMTYEDLIRSCVAWNVDGLDMTVYWLPNTEAAWLHNLRRLAYRNGIEIYSIAIRTELTKPDQAARDAEVENIRKWVEVASMVGAGHIRVFGGTVPKTATEEQAAPWVVECLKRGAEIAGAKGIMLGLENHGGICTNASRILEMVKQVNSPWVGINLDTGNFRTKAFEQMEMCLPQAVNVQVKAEMIHEDGKAGPQDWDRVIKLIAGGGYKGYLSLEYEAKEPAATAVPRGLAQIRELCRKYSA
ncbi:MAG: sugar phosphate isomerase/epimerase [Acidobacteria bacterium]|nr:sugar phosphate isomerase/epimerase [Acidobacteriota bacterium]